ncbi:SCO family protein [Rubritalea spongiae]|uniref:SCO family protein n=1 Tax=Rubritalea spongiae TaxID=430797 RepID=A0ABW5DZA3_9BACT
MKDKTKITLIYVGVGVLSIVLISVFMWLGKQRSSQAEQSEERRNAIVIEEVVKPLTKLDKQLTEDLEGVNQDGEEVSLYDLKGKAVVFAQFYSRCNMCLGHNKTIMQELHNELKENPNVHFVTVTLDPDFDSPEKLAESAKVWGADSDSWWMLNVPKEKLTKYCREQLWYIDFADNEDKTSAADAINHDMGIAVIDADSKLRAKVNLYELKSSGQDELYEAKKSQLLEVVDLAVGEADE